VAYSSVDVSVMTNIAVFLEMRSFISSIRASKTTRLIRPLLSRIVLVPNKLFEAIKGVEEVLTRHVLAMQEVARKVVGKFITFMSLFHTVNS
jgi:hypothetical protein